MLLAYGQPDILKNRLADYIDIPFLHGESYADVEKRLKDFVKFIKRDYEGQSIAISAHQAPQLALEVLLNGKTWAKAIAEDWRRTKSWQPRWEYEIKKAVFSTTLSILHVLIKCCPAPVSRP
ncbi:MAG: histidine phosphatase family protein [Patescibacteria group bacterium]